MNVSTETKNRITRTKPQALHCCIPPICEARIQTIPEHVQQLTLTPALISLHHIFLLTLGVKKENCHRKKYKQLDSFRVLGYLDSKQEPNSINRTYKYFQWKWVTENKNTTELSIIRVLYIKGFVFSNTVSARILLVRVRKIHSNEFK